MIVPDNKNHVVNINFFDNNEKDEVSIYYKQNPIKNLNFKGVKFIHLKYLGPGEDDVLRQFDVSGVSIFPLHEMELLKEYLQFPNTVSVMEYNEMGDRSYFSHYFEYLITEITSKLSDEKNLSGYFPFLGMISQSMSTIPEHLQRVLKSIKEKISGERTLQQFRFFTDTQDDGTSLSSWFSEKDFAEKEICVFPVHLRMYHPIEMIETEADRFEILKIFESNAKPVKLQLLKGEEVVGNPFIYKKGDDLRQDFVCVQIEKLLNCIWKKENLNISGYVVTAETYTVIYLPKKTGFIEFVPGTNSLTDTAGFEENLIKNTFSMVSFAVGLFVSARVLGLRDRHSDNFLHLEGKMLSIDFGFVLAKSPLVDSGATAITVDFRNILKKHGV